MRQQLKMLHLLFTGTKLQQQMKNVVPFSYGKQNTTTNEKCCTVNQLRKRKCNNRWKILHRSYTETKMQQQLKMLHRLFTETKMQQKMKDVSPFSHGKQNTTTDEKYCTVQLWKTKYNIRWKCCIVYLGKPKYNIRWKMLHRLFAENKMQQQMKNVTTFSYGNQNAT